MIWDVLLHRFLDRLHLFRQAFTQDLRDMSLLGEDILQYVAKLLIYSPACDLAKCHAGSPSISWLIESIES